MAAALHGWGWHSGFGNCTIKCDSSSTCDGACYTPERQMHFLWEFEQPWLYHRSRRFGDLDWEYHADSSLRLFLALEWDRTHHDQRAVQVDRGIRGDSVRGAFENSRRGQACDRAGVLGSGAWLVADRDSGFRARLLTSTRKWSRPRGPVRSMAPRALPPPPTPADLKCGGAGKCRQRSRVRPATPPPAPAPVSRRFRPERPLAHYHTAMAPIRRRPM